MAHIAPAFADWQFVDLYEQPDSTESLLARLREFCLPGGEDAARRIREVKITEKGEMRASRQARWLPFTAEQTIYSTESDFCWNAHLKVANLVPVTITDAYQQGHGVLLARVGPVTTKSIAGPDADLGELQRYLASLIFCPAMLLNHPSLVWTAAGILTLRVSDRQDPRGATVDIELSENGKPVACRADRPRLVGKQTILTPWMGIGSDFREHDGFRVPNRLEVSWLIDGWFEYYRSEITSFEVAR